MASVIKELEEIRQDLQLLMEDIAYAFDKTKAIAKRLREQIERLEEE